MGNRSRTSQPPRVGPKPGDDLDTQHHRQHQAGRNCSTHLAESGIHSTFSTTLNTTPLIHARTLRTKCRNLSATSPTTRTNAVPASPYRGHSHVLSAGCSSHAPRSLRALAYTAKQDLKAMPTHPDSRATAPAREKIECLSVGDMRAPLCDFRAETTPPGALSTREGEAPTAPSAIHAGRDVPSMNQDAHSVKHNPLTAQSHPPPRGCGPSVGPPQVENGPASPRNRRGPSPQWGRRPLPLSRARRPFPAVLMPSPGHVTPATRLNPPHSPPRFVGSAGHFTSRSSAFTQSFRGGRGGRGVAVPPATFFFFLFNNLSLGGSGGSLFSGTPT
ncbi:hypothetical protein SAMN04488504_10949 [Myxococcus virescens]|uniref:Uncharacterized protein n=1 Tax=Myxococcus virescens TaxID=83456 RepID=A0ABY0MXN0_9BACT|nr:hypothetical protein SAMN04488504_10949 [Myxococcus virescens]